METWEWILIVVDIAFFCFACYYAQRTYDHAFASVPRPLSQQWEQLTNRVHFDVTREEIKEEELLCK